MKNIAKFVVIICLLAATALHAQNWATVTASNITDLNQNKLAAGQLCFLGTDQNDNPISFGVGGGGQVLRRAFCSTVANGAVTAFTVPNPANTQPAGIYYRVTVKDSSTGVEVLRYTQVTFSGTSFSFDSYAPVLAGSFAPLTGTSVSGNLSVSGNASVTGSLTAASVTSGQFASNTANAAGSGMVRLASGDCVKFRNNANTADVNGVCKNASDQVTLGSGPWVVPAASDQSVGRATSDTLSNKTLNGAANGNSVTLLNQQGPGSALTGNSTDQAVYTYTLPANTLGPGKGLRITVVTQHSSGTAVITYKLVVGGTTITSNNYAPNNNSNLDKYVFEVYNNSGVQTAQNWLKSAIFNLTGNTVQVLSVAAGTSSLNFVNGQAVSFTFNVASTDQLIPWFWSVELIQ